MEPNCQDNLPSAGAECQAGNLALGDLKSVLRARQQARNRKSCLPCRERKVRCNRDHPCLTCCKRGHPDLCQYQDVRQQPLPDQPATAPTYSQSGQARDPSEASYLDDTQNSPTAGNACTSSQEEARTNSSLLGGRSILAITRENSVQPQDDPDRQRAFETGLLPLLGIDGERHSGSESNPNNCSYSSLPRDEELIKLFGCFRDRVYPLHFAMLDLPKIEQTVCAIILAPGSRGTEGHAPLSGDAHFLGLLHAILACGAQFSDLTAQHRLKLSQKHSKHAFDALRITDYLLKPCKDSLQTLILLGIVLQNNMNPRAAWILGGTTIRLALSLGIHSSSGRYQRSQVSPEDAKSLRQAIVWQDTLLSLAFDRPASSHEMDFEDDLPPLIPSSADALDYRYAMHWLCHLNLRHFSLRSGAASMDKFSGFLRDMELLQECLAPHLKDRQNCCSIQEIQEHYGFELHRNFSISTLCRPIVSRKFRMNMEPNDVALIMDVFQTSLKRSAQAFIQLHAMTSYARRSWAFIHNGLTAALLLSFMKDTRNNPETKEIQTELARCLTEEERDFAGNPEAGASSQLSNPHKKSLQALQTLSQLSDEERINGNSSNQADPQHMDSNPNLLAIDQEGGAQGNLDMDEWLRSYDLDSYSPLQVFDFIMSDQDASDMDLRNIGIA